MDRKERASDKIDGSTITFEGVDDRGSRKEQISLNNGVIL